nr:TPA_asm: hypothetical protein HUJ06_028076 [Nelumbo nucifera]
MQIYSIILGRNNKKSTVDVDLASLGSNMNPPVKLDSQDLLLQIGDKKFYLLLNVCNILGGSLPVTSLTLLHPFRRPLHICPLHGLRYLHRRITLPRRGGVGRRVIIWTMTRKTRTTLLLQVLARNYGEKSMRCLDMMDREER